MRLKITELFFVKALFDLIQECRLFMANQKKINIQEPGLKSWALGWRQIHQIKQNRFLFSAKFQRFS